MQIFPIILRLSFFYSSFLRFYLPIFSQQVRVGGRNKIHLDHFSIELKIEGNTIFKIAFPSILIQLENGPN